MKQNPEMMVSDMSSLLSVSAEAQAGVMRQAELMVEAPVKALTLWQSLSSVWLQRRTEDMRLCMEMTQRLSACRDIGQATEIYTGWLSESMRRLREEVSTAPEQMSTLGIQCLNTLQGLANAEPGKSAPSAPSAVRRAA